MRKCIWYGEKIAQLFSNLLLILSVFWCSHWLLVSGCFTNEAGHQVSPLVERQLSHSWFPRGNFWFPCTYPHQWHVPFSTLVSVSAPFDMHARHRWQRKILPGWRSEPHAEQHCFWGSVHYDTAAHPGAQWPCCAANYTLPHNLKFDVFLNLVHVSLQAINSWRAETMTCVFKNITSKYQVTLEKW